MSVASYSAILADTFATVGLSTLIPATFVAVARGMHAAEAIAAGETATPERKREAGLARIDVGQIVPIGPAQDLVRHIAESEETLDLLIPKTARIQATFEMQAGESYEEGASAGVAVDCVTIKAGMSALYSTKSSAKINLDLKFALANFLLEEPGA